MWLRQGKHTDGEVVFFALTVATEVSDDISKSPLLSLYSADVASTFWWYGWLSVLCSRDWEVGRGIRLI